MLDPIRHPRLLRLRLLWERLKGKFFRAPSRQEEADRQLSAFYDRVWREAAAQVGATVADLGHNVLEICRGERWTRVWHRSSNNLFAACSSKVTPAARAGSRIASLAAFSFSSSRRNRLASRLGSSGR